MRSTSPPPLPPPSPRSPTRGHLSALAGIVDQSTAHAAGHVLVHVEGPFEP